MRCSRASRLSMGIRADHENDRYTAGSELNLLRVSSVRTFAFASFSVVARDDEGEGANFSPLDPAFDEPKYLGEFH